MVTDVGRVAEYGRVTVPKVRTEGAVTTFMGGTEFGGDAVAGNKIVNLATTSLAEPPRQLPLDVPGFTGRREALAKLDALVDARETGSLSVIVAITGMPGVGKTALAVHWSHRMAHHFPHGHLFIDLRGYSERAALSPQEALGRHFALWAFRAAESRPTRTKRPLFTGLRWPPANCSSCWTTPRPRSRSSR